MKTNHGIYKIINLQNNKIYIGSSSNLKSRKYKHFLGLKNNKHCNYHLQNSYNKYGKENFKWEIIEYIKYDENIEILKNNLLEREQYYLNLYESYNPEKGYNICSIAGSRLGSEVSEKTKQKISEGNRGKIVSEESKKKISKNHKKPFLGKHRSEEVKNKISESHRGRIFSEESRKKMSESAKRRISNRKGTKHSEETLRKMSEIKKGKICSEETKRKMRESHKNK